MTLYEIILPDVLKSQVNIAVGDDGTIILHWNAPAAIELCADKMDLTFRPFVVNDLIIRTRKVANHDDR